MENMDRDARVLANRLRRQKQVRRNIIILIVCTVMIITFLISLISFSTQANDLEHASSYKYYKSIEISKGDTLWSIAKEHFDPEHYKDANEYINEVKRMNGLFSDEIQSGSHLIVPYYSSEFISTAAD